MSWDVIKSDEGVELFPKEFNGATKGEKILKLSAALQKHITMVYSGQFNISHAERVAAMALDLQIELSDLVAEAEFKFKSAKHEIDYVQADSAFNFRKSSESKVTDSAVKQSVDRDANVKQAKQTMIEMERDYEKWKNLLITYKESHVFFRTMAKG